MAWPVSERKRNGRCEDRDTPTDRKEGAQRAKIFVSPLNTLPKTAAREDSLSNQVDKMLWLLGCGQTLSLVPRNQRKQHDGRISRVAYVLGEMEAACGPKGVDSH